MLPRDERVVIVAMDRSAHSQNAFEWYLLNVHSENDKVILLHIPEYENVTHTVLDDRMENRSNAVSEESERTRISFLENLEALLQEKQLKGEVRTVNGEPGETIVRVAVQENADVIVLGNRGMGQDQCVELGAVSEYVIRHTPAPVVLCKGLNDQAP